MSRSFTDIAGSQSIRIPASSLYNSFSAVTFAAWVNVSDYSLFPTVFVSDPTGLYSYSLLIEDDGTLFFGIGFDAVDGFVTGLIVNPGHEGTGYATHDTGIASGHGVLHARTIVNQVDGGGAGPGVISDVSRLSSFGGSGYAVNDTGAITNSGAQPGVGTGGQYKITSVANAHVAFASAASVETIALDTWTHIACTWSLADGYPHVYINGVEVTYASRAGASGIVAVTGDIWLGTDSFGDTLLGDIAEFAIYNSELSAVQVAALAASAIGATGSPVGYWHLCGDDDPELDSSGNGNSASLFGTPLPGKGPNSPGFTCVTVGPTTDGTVGVGQYGGNSLAEAFYNPHHLDILQVVNEGGEVIWNLDYAGEAEDNPDDATPQALLGKFIGQTFAAAFPNPYNENILQIVGQGDNIVFWVDYQGNAGTA